MNKKEKVERVKELLKAKHKEQQTETVKTSETPQVLTPLERAMALRRKSASKFDSMIMGKYLPGLDK